MTVIAPAHSVAAHSLLERLRRAVEFDHVFIAGGRGHGIGVGACHYATWPPLVLNTYLKGKMFLADPVVEAIRRGAHVVEPGVAETLDGARPGSEAMTLRRSAGLALPTAVVVTHGGKAVGSVSFSRRKAFDDVEMEMITSLAGRLHQAFCPPPGHGVCRLTRREIECLQYSANGKTAWEISRILAISEHTVSSYLGSTIEKLDVANKSAAIAEAMRHGLIV